MQNCDNRNNAIALARKAGGWNSRKSASSDEDSKLMNHMANCQCCKEAYNTERAYLNRTRPNLRRSFA